jgi:phasin
MTTATTAKTKPSPAVKPATIPAAVFEMPKFDMPKFEFPTFELPKFDFATFGMPKMEVPAAFREYAEKGIAHAKETYEKVKASADEANGIVEATLTTASKAAADYGLKVTEAARTNTNAAFDFAQDVAAIKSVSDFLALSAEHSRKQFEVLTAQAKELAALAQKLATETTAPAKAGFEKALKQAS